MASGRTHAAVAWTLSIPLGVAGAYAYLTGYPALGIGIGCGTLAGILVTPDADLEGTTWEEQRIYRLSTLLGLLWQWAWFLYARAIPHRGISHTPILGTLTRLIYIVIFFHIMIWLVTGAWLHYCQIAGCIPQIIRIPWGAIDPQAWGGLVAAWSIQDLGHILFDRKRKTRKRKPRIRHLLLPFLVIMLTRILCFIKTNVIL